MICKKGFETAYPEVYDYNFSNFMGKFEDCSEKNGYDLDDSVLKIGVSPDKKTLKLTYIFNYENRTTWQWLYLTFSGDNLKIENIETYGEGSLNEIPESYDTKDELIESDYGWGYTFSNAGDFYKILSEKKDVNLSELKDELK